MKIIKTKSGAEILVSEADYEALSQFKWRLSAQGYPIRHMHREDGKKTVVAMHRMLMGLKRGDGLCVDHINGDKLDNRRENLRVCTKAQNMWNRGATKLNQGGLKGVSRARHGKRFVARIHANGRRINLGAFETRDLAHEFYCLAADLLHGEFSNHG